MNNDGLVSFGDNRKFKGNKLVYKSNIRSSYNFLIFFMNWNCNAFGPFMTRNPQNWISGTYSIIIVQYCRTNTLDRIWISHFICTKGTNWPWYEKKWKVYCMLTKRNLLFKFYFWLTILIPFTSIRYASNLSPYLKIKEVKASVLIMNLIF